MDFINKSRRVSLCDPAPSSSCVSQPIPQQTLRDAFRISGRLSPHISLPLPPLTTVRVLGRPYVVSDAVTATWAVSPICGLDNMRVLVRAVLQLLNHTVGVNGRHRSRTLGLGGEAAVLVPLLYFLGSNWQLQRTTYLPPIGFTLNWALALWRIMRDAWSNHACF